MRAREILFENKIVANKTPEGAKALYELIINNSHAMKWLKESEGREFFRGTSYNDLVGENVAAITKTPREDRRPVDTNDLLNQAFMEAIKEKGGVASRNNSFFCVANYTEAAQYSQLAENQVWVLIPLAKYNYTWSKSANDWTRYYQDQLEEFQEEWLREQTADLDLEIDDLNRNKEVLERRVAQLEDDLSSSHAELRYEEDPDQERWIEKIIGELEEELEEARTSLHNTNSEIDDLNKEKRFISDKADNIDRQHDVYDKLVEDIYQDTVVDKELSGAGLEGHEVMLKAQNILHIDASFYTQHIKNKIGKTGIWNWEIDPE